MNANISEYLKGADFYVELADFGTIDMCFTKEQQKRKYCFSINFPHFFLLKNNFIMYKSHISFEELRTKNSSVRSATPKEIKMYKLHEKLSGL